jgi:glycogen debranching enzyme
MAMAGEKLPAFRPISRALQGTLCERLQREWLLTTGRGGFAAGTVVGVPTRRYHGLLVASRRAPLQRFMTVVGVLDTVRFGERAYVLSAWDRDGVVDEDPLAALRDFTCEIRSPRPWVEWRYRLPEGDLRKRLSLVAGYNGFLLEYTITATVEGTPIWLEVAPLLALRDFHSAREVDSLADWSWQADEDGFVALAADTGASVAVVADGSSGCRPAEVRLGVHYVVDSARGYPARELLGTQYVFAAEGATRLEAALGGLAFAESLKGARQAMRAMQRVGPSHWAGDADADRRTTARLRAAAEQFLAVREHADGATRATILAGFPWFGDWGRDAFIALEGLLLCAGDFARAREVLATFAAARRHGLIPNLFDDYGRENHYNSADASLWFIHAADRYLARSGDRKAWGEFLAEACRDILTAFRDGTDFGIHAGPDGLVSCGHPQVQITWMDAKCGDVVFTPRHGRPVEINALWHRALRVAERRFAKTDRTFAEECARLASTVRESFRRTFVRPDGLGLYDVVREDGPDPAVRPNQLFAVSLPEALLDDETARAVLNVVTDRLLTPYGLRTLAPEDPQYRGRYEGGPYERDAAYHQGTVWSWLIGPYVEAYLRVHGRSAESRAHARKLLQPLIAHLDEAGLGSVSEIFDGDPPHRPVGCFAQAWSVAELIRARELCDA